MTDDKPNSGPEDLPATIDLMALAVALEARGGKRKLTGALRNAWRTGSCLADLRQAHEACEALDELAKTKPAFNSRSLLQIQSALLATAILLYARATHTGSGKGERGGVRLDPSKLTAQQQDDHRTLIRLRNSALGHVGRGEKIAGDFWHQGYLFAKRQPGGQWGLGSGHVSIGFQLEALAMLRRQLPAAIEIIGAKCRERLDDATEAVNETRPSEALLSRHRVDPIVLFGSVDNARLMLSGKPGEEISAWMPLV